MRIVCEFLGYPSPNITITKNGVELAEGKTMVSYKIDDIKQSSFGAYLCSAINKNGKANHTIELRRAGMCYANLSSISPPSLNARGE